MWCLNYGLIDLYILICIFGMIIDKLYYDLVFFIS